MNTRTAIKNEMNHRGNREANIQAIYDEVEPLCKTATDGDGGVNTTLWDWLYEGQYESDDTAQSIADEWDELSEE